MALIPCGLDGGGISPARGSSEENLLAILDLSGIFIAAVSSFEDPVELVAVGKKILSPDGQYLPGRDL